MHQTDLGREHNILQYVILTLDVHHRLMSLCQKWELFLSSIGVKVNEQCCWDTLLSQQMLYAINTSLTTIFSFSNCKTVSALMYCDTAKLSTSFLLTYGHIKVQSLTKLTDYEMSGITQQHEHELQVTRVNKLSQRLVEVWQCNNAAFVFLHFARVSS